MYMRCLICQMWYIKSPQLRAPRGTKKTYQRPKASVHVEYLSDHILIFVSRLSLYTRQVAHQGGAYPGFCSMKRLGVFYYPLDGMLVHHVVTPNSKFAGTH